MTSFGMLTQEKIAVQMNHVDNIIDIWLNHNIIRSWILKNYDPNYNLKYIVGLFTSYVAYCFMSNIAWNTVIYEYISLSCVSIQCTRADPSSSSTWRWRARTWTWPGSGSASWPETRTATFSPSRDSQRSAGGHLMGSISVTSTKCGSFDLNDLFERHYWWWWHDA